MSVRHVVRRIDPYGIPEYAGLRVDDAYTYRDAITDEELRAQITRAEAVLAAREFERREATP